MKRLCRSCNVVQDHASRGLCHTCYAKHHKNKTLNRFPVLGPPRNGVPEIEGLTYRQLDYWTTKGYLHPLHGTGSGIARVWPDEELAVARMMARLVGAGLTLALAARVARGEEDVAPGVKVLVTT